MKEQVGKESLFTFANSWLRERKEQRKRDAEVVGLMWVWDHVEPMTREQAEFYERELLPFGHSVLVDNR